MTPKDCTEKNFSNLKLEYLCKKGIFKKNYFSLLIRRQARFDSWKKGKQNLVTLPL